ncbi:MAG: DNA polymerase/3'-5' exonuclease PolX [Candidatus Sumerlaea sp.]|nr:MAG: DNA polymerase/3'-5' exonuclease PolX [Candidatus Sumerlaea sp.]
MGLALDKAAIIQLLERIAFLLEYQGANPFKVRAFANAARALQNRPESLEELVSPGKLEEIEGIGKSIAGVIREAANTGTCKEYEELRQQAPEGFDELIKIPNLGPKKLRALVENLGIRTIADLENACREGRVAKLPGFGLKSEEKLLAGIEQIKRFAGQWLYAEALDYALRIRDTLERLPAAIAVAPAGSLRRCKEIVRDLDFVVASETPEEVIQAFVTHNAVVRILSQGTTKASVLLQNGMQADLRVVDQESFAAALQYFTGSKEHNTTLRARARKMGYRLNEYGLFETPSLSSEDEPADPSAGRRLSLASEEELYGALGLQYIEPELREDMGEIEAAEEGKLPTLVRFEDYRGVLHCHSTWSDGRTSIAELAEAAFVEWKWEYLAICDHSQVATYANGVKIDDLRRQHAEIDAINRKLSSRGFRILKGCECDILADGSLDYPDEVLKAMELVVVSVHSRFQMSEEEMTERLLRAIRHPYADILGHVSGRLLLARDAYAVDYQRIFEVAAEWGTIIEINGDPNRLDLDWRLCKRAKEMGIKFAVNPDAHSREGLANVKYGINVARKGWLEPADVVNCLPLEEFKSLIHKLRKRKLEKLK